MDTIKKLDLGLLVTLEALLIERNVTRAAVRLSLSQPAVSAQLSRLRILFGDPLLLPVQRGMAPTAKAVELLAPLRAALDQVRATLEQHDRFDPPTSPMTAVFACTDYLQLAVIQPLVMALRTEAPHVRVAVRHLNPHRLHVQMGDGEVDLALMSPEHAPPGLRSRALFDERYVLISSLDNAAVSRGMSLEQFQTLSHVIVSLRGGDFTTFVDDELAALGCQRNVVLSVASFLSVPELVASSDLVALVPERLVRGRGALLKIVDSPVPVRGFSVGLLWHERSHAHAGQRWLRERIVDLVGTTR